MAKEGQKETSRTTTPTRLAETPPQSYSADYSFLEIVMGMQATMGKLSEAVESLKEQSRDDSKKLDEIRMDVHAAKTTVKIVGAILAAGMALAGWIINKGFDSFVQLKQQTPAIVQSMPASPPSPVPGPQQKKP